MANRNPTHLGPQLEFRAGCSTWWAHENETLLSGWCVYFTHPADVDRKRGRPQTFSIGTQSSCGHAGKTSWTDCHTKAALWKMARCRSGSHWRPCGIGVMYGYSSSCGHRTRRGVFCTVCNLLI